MKGNGLPKLYFQYKSQSCNNLKTEFKGVCNPEKSQLVINFCITSAKDVIKVETMWKH